MTTVKTHDTFYALRVITIESRPHEGMLSLSRFVVALGSFGSTFLYTEHASMPRVRRCDGLKMEQQQGTRNPLRLAVLKLGATEPAFTSPLHQETSAGRYECAGCGTTLFDSTGKYSCPCGWPSFYRSAAEDLLQYKREWDGRVEVSCKCCNGHLGHVFSDGPRVLPDDSVPESDPKYRSVGRHPRFCINGASLWFRPEQQDPEDA